MAPELCCFKAYDATDMTMIIKEKLHAVEREFLASSPLHTASTLVCLFQNSAIDMCVKKSSGTGDIRKAFAICK